VASAVASSCARPAVRNLVIFLRLAVRVRIGRVLARRRRDRDVGAVPRSPTRPAIARRRSSPSATCRTRSSAR
jgi:hypothetical protein